MSTVAERPATEVAPEDADHLDIGEPLFEQRERITVAQYHRMFELGIYDSDSKVELIEGVLVAKRSKDVPHIISSELIVAIFHRLIPLGYFLTMGNPLTIVERDSEPEPDAQIFRGHPRDYRGRRRTQRDAALVVEVSDSTYRMDRYRKWVTYAGAGVRIYWIVDVNRNRLEVHTDPTGSGPEARYATTQVLGPDDEVGLILDDREVARFAVREILP